MTIAISFVNRAQNERTQEGALDADKEVTGAEAGMLVSPQAAAAAITDTQAYATCP